MEAILALMIPISAFIMVFGIVYVERTAKHREIMAAIEKGIDPKDLNISAEKSDKFTNGYTFAGAGFGIFIGYLLTSITSITPVAAYLSMGFLFGGLALIYANSLKKKKEEEESWRQEKLLN